MTKTSKRNIARNSGFLYIRMIVTMIISLYTSRVILLYLGAVDFGIYGVVWSTVSLFSFFNLSMTTAFRRCLSFELGKKNERRYYQVLGTLIRYSLIIGLSIYALQELGGTYILDNKLNIPIDRHNEAVVSYHILCIVFFISVMQIPFVSSLISQERIKVFSFINIFDSILKLILVLFLSLIKYDMLVTYSFLLLTQYTIVFILYLYFSVRKIRLNFKRDIVIDKEINKYLGWNLLGGVSSVGLNQIIQILINIFFSPVVNAAQTIATQVRGSVESFTSNIRVSFNPPLIKSSAKGDHQETVELLSFSVRFSSIAVLLITIPLISKLDYILKLWLINPPEYSYILCFLFLINSIIDNVSTPMVSVIQASGDIRKYQIITSIILLTILPLTYFSYTNGGGPEVYGYFFIISSILILFVRISFIKRIISVKIVDMVKLIFTQIIIVPILSLLIPLFMAYTMEDTLINLVIIVLVSVAIVFLFSWILILQPKEKTLIVDYLKIKLNKS